MRAGRLDEALTRATWALELARTHRERATGAWANRLLGKIAASRNPLDAVPAEAHYQDALAAALELGMRPLLAHCHLGLGKLYGGTGQETKAKEQLTTATTMYRAMGMAFWLEQAEAALAGAP